jgi:hypothetical protein
MRNENINGFEIPDGYATDLRKNILSKVQHIAPEPDQIILQPLLKQEKPNIWMSPKWLAVAASVSLLLAIGILSLNYLNKYSTTAEIIFTEEDLIPLLEMDDVIANPLFYSYIKSIDENIMMDEEIDQQFIFIDL